ncbi:MAG TPA: translocation/assembly module TamB domain-containing protein [Chryseosolibacter sp.]|nr:translocation/assembly module TamB domain-containing protein [Chryseosolibacter sp.]
MISAFLALQIPAVQEYFIKRYLSQFSSIVGFNTTIESFQLLWFDRLELTGVRIFDPENNKMIAAESIRVNFELSQLVEERDINIDGIHIDEAAVLVTKINETDTSRNLNINVFVDRINERFGGSGSGKPPIVNIGEAFLENSAFAYINQDADSIKKGFNYNQFLVRIDEAQLHNFLILGDTTQFNVNTLVAHDEQTKFPIKHLSTFFRLSQQSMEFSGLDLQAGESTISDSILFTFNRQRELDDFIEKVNINATFRNTFIQPADLALFVHDAAILKKPITLSGKMKGRINNFRFRDMEVTMGNTLLTGSIDMEGLPDIDETFIVLRLKNSNLDFNDLSFALTNDIIKRLTPMGHVMLHGEFVGYTTDFVANGDFSGDLGRISSDINFKVNEKDFDRSQYSGKLTLHDFKLGAYLGDTVNFQKVNLSGNVKGSGLTAGTADFVLNGRVNAIGIRNYAYRNITTNARFSSQLFNGYVKINDPNLQLEATGTVNLRQNQQAIKIKATLDTAKLENLGLTKDHLVLHSKLDIDTKGLHIDSLTGVADLTDFYVEYKDNALSLKNIHLLSSRSTETRNIAVTTNLVSAEMNGNYLLSDISKDIQTLVREIALNIRNNEEEIRSYYQQKTYRPKSYYSDFRITLHDVSPISALFNEQLNVSKESVLEGKFTSGYTSILQAYTMIDSAKYNNTLFLNTSVELTTSKIADSTSVLAMAFVHSDRQTFSPKFSTENLVGEAIWNKNHIDFQLDGDQQGQPNYVRLDGAIDFRRDSTQIKILPSTLKVLEKIWDFDPENVITITRDDIRVSHLAMRNDNQLILASGTLSHDPAKRLSIQLKDIDLSQINAVIENELSGTVNAIVDISNYFVSPYIQNTLRVDSLTFDNFLIGNITGQNLWDTVQNRFDINLLVERNKAKIVDVEGFYNPSDKVSPLDLGARLQDANLKIIAPFLEEVFDDVGGTATGDFRITGQLAEPQIRGKGHVPDGLITVGYLKTTYNFVGNVGLTPNSIYFEDIVLTDLFSNKGALEGTITHRNFYKMALNISATFNEMQLLNTTARDNSLFYGQGYATGDVSIFGPIANLKITVNARTDRNTRISIPIGTTSEVEKKEFIKFVSFTDSTFQKSLEEQVNNTVDLTGITMDFNLAVTPEAYCEIIFDIKAGDIIRGRGFGDLQFQLDTKGDFNMFGPFEFTEGYYNFTLYDIINKDFEIKKGSRINWYGDAYQGILDISATYDQLASFHPILTDQTLIDQPQLRRKYPVQVLLDLDGPMLSPQIDFDVVANDLPQSIVVENGPPVRLDFEFQAFKNRIDEQELKRQVFSLIVLRRFSPPESFNTSGSLANSVSELLSNQLSNWISQVDENLEIDIDMSSFDQEAFNTFQLRLSYTFLNGRLRVTRDGTFYGNTNQPGTLPQQQNSISTIAGDWTVDYLLTGDGKLRVKMFNRTNINPVLNSINQNQVTTGVSLTHVQSFNQLKDLWISARKRKKLQPEETEDGAQNNDTNQNDTSENN